MRNAYTLRTLATCALLCLAGSAALAQPTAIVDAKDASSTTRLRVDVYGGILAPGVFNDGSPEKSGSLPQVEGSGTRMMWYPGKAAFRAGGINGTQWDDANIGLYSTAFGENVRASGDNAIAVGKNTVAVNTGTVAMGEGITATGANSVSLGYGASTSTSVGAPRTGSFVFADRSQTLTYSNNSTTPDNQFYAELTNAAHWRVVNGFRIYTATDRSTGFHVLPGMNNSFSWSGCSHTNTAVSTSTCAYLTSGGTWTNSSDVNRKRDFTAVSGEDVLARLRAMPVSTWSYKAEDARIRHMGPTAQDFQAAFGLGHDDKSIATVDADGVAIAAAKALEARTATQATEIAALRTENDALRARLEALERRSAPTTAGLPVALGLLLAGTAAGFALRRRAPVGPSGWGT